MLYEHQKEMLAFSLKNPRCSYFAEMGTGKTRPAILTYVKRRADSNMKCLVICPASIVYNWEREIEQADSSLTVSVIYGTPKKRYEALDKDVDVYIINYDYIGKVISRLKAKKFGMLIVDELTYVKHHTTRRSKFLRELSKDIPYRLGLTGSPITNSLMDIFGEMLVIEPRIFGTNYFAFRGRYFVNVGKHFPLYVPKRDTVERIPEAVKDYCIFLDKKDCLDLPEVVFERRVVPMEGKLKRDYEEMKNHLLLELEEDDSIASVSIVLTKLLRLSQITSGFIVNDRGSTVSLGYNPKFKELESLIDNELAGKKVIVWCKFKHTIHALMETFSKLNPAVVCGDVKDKQAEIDKFQNDPKCMMFIGQVKTSFGYNLTKSDTMVYLEHDFSVEARSQSLARNNRIGQTADKLTVIDLVVENSIDTYTLDSVDKKQGIADKVYDILK